MHIRDLINADSFDKENRYYTIRVQRKFIYLNSFDKPFTIDISLYSDTTQEDVNKLIEWLQGIQFNE